MGDYTEKLNTLLSELGTSTQSVIQIEEAAPNLWLIALDNFDSAIALRLDSETGTITFSCELGRPREEVRALVYETLLTYNALAELHGGVRMGLREPGGSVIQEFDIALSRLDLFLMRHVLEDFSNKAAAWEDIIESSEPAEVQTKLTETGWAGLRV